MSNFKPFRIVIAGRTINELVEHAEAFVKEMSAKNVIAKESPSTPKVEITTPVQPVQVAPPPMVSVPEAPTPSVGNKAVDSRGMLWDERIHSANMSTNKDGSWRYRRGVDESVVASVEAELRARGSAQPVGVAIVPQVPAPPASQPEFAQPPLVGNVEVQPVASPVPAAVVTPSPAPIVPPIASTVAPPPPIPVPQNLLSAHTPETFKANLVPILAQLVTEKKLTQEYINQLKDYFKVEHIFQISDEQSRQMFEQFVAGGLIVRAM